MAKASILDKHGEMMLIDSLVKTYPSYTHDDIFNMEVSLAMSLVLINRESKYVSDSTQDIMQKVNKAKRN